MVEFYKLSHLSFNKMKTTLCLCYNKGVKTYSTEDFSLKLSSNNNEIELGDVSICSLLHEFNTIVFTGSENNDKYSNKKLVIYDMAHHKFLYETLFENPITNIKSISKYIFISSGNTINIYSYNVDFSNISYTRNFEIENIEHPIFEIWETNDEIKKIYISTLNSTGNNFIVSSYFDNEFEDDKKYQIPSNYKNIQNMFFVEEYQMLFIVDYDGRYFSSYSFPEYKKLCDFYRGKNPGTINNIIAVYNNYIAVSNLNKTIHLYSVNTQQNNGLVNYVYSFFKEQVAYSCLKIRINDIVNETKFNFFDCYFNKNGSLLYFDKKKNNLIPICYNGFAYIIKINLLKMTYEVVKSINFIKESLENFGKSVDVGGNVDLYHCSVMEDSAEMLKKETLGKSFQIV